MEVKKFNRLLQKVRTSCEALIKLYNHFFPLIVFHINRSFHGKLDGKEIAQEFFLELLKMEVKDYINYPLSWVYTISEHIAIKFLRKHDKRKTAESKSAVDEKSIEVKEDGTEILNCLEERERQIVYLHYWEDYQFKEIAQMLGMNYSTLKSAYKKAKAILKNQIQKENENEKN